MKPRGLPPNGTPGAAAGGGCPAPSVFHGGDEFLTRQGLVAVLVEPLEEFLDHRSPRLGHFVECYFAIAILVEAGEQALGAPTAVGVFGISRFPIGWF